MLPSLSQALDAGLRNRPDDWDDKALHISDLGTAIGEGCPRALWLRLNGAKKKEATTGKLLMFHHGQRIHEDLVELITPHLPDEWHIIKVEQPVEVYGLTGRYDYQMIHKDGTKVIVDFKSIRGRAFNYLDGPKPAHVIQVQGYMAAEDADHGIIWYVDREGQNASQQFVVERDDDRVEIAAMRLGYGARHKNPPLILDPVLEIKENKGPDSVKVKQPWQCDYCDYLDVSCPGALPKEMRERGIVGKLGMCGDYMPTKGNEDMVNLVKELRRD